VIWVWTAIGVAFIVWFALVLLFTPRIDYRVTTRLSPDTDEFLHTLRYTCQAEVHAGNQVEILIDGAHFYPAMLDAIRSASTSVHLEAYIFEPGEIGDLMIEALAQRARVGVDVRVVLDAIGSSRMGAGTARRLTDAGGRLAFYQPLRWHLLHRLNNRTHRELLVVDGRTAFVGGAGVADWWLRQVPPSGLNRLLARLGGRRRVRTRGPWRDTMVRIDGPVVAACQGVFAENWLECCGEILTSTLEWPRLPPAGPVDALLVRSSPADRATSSRVVFQMLIEGAGASIDICTPYFLPDRALRRALVAAVARGVRVRVIVPGSVSDQRLVRLASRRGYGELLERGVRIHEYRSRMLHAKTLLVDAIWSVVGTTNVDNRSFEHNDEINVALRESDVTLRLQRQFETDLAASDEVTLDAWRKRPVLERIVGPVCWILERQQ
jgi:cardiolipin synthase A/B